MQREQSSARMLVAGIAVSLTGTLYAAFGWVDAAAYAAILAVLGGLYLVRHSTRRACRFGGRSDREPRTRTFEDDVRWMPERLARRSI
jgi:hypothetical protein